MSTSTQTAAERRLGVVAALLLLLAALSVVSLLCGTVWLRPAEFAGSDATARMARLILIDLRLPRLVLALLVGGALGLSGAVLQGVTRNPLAEPGLLGVSEGAAFGAVVAVYFGLAGHFEIATPVLGLLGAAVAMTLTFALGRGGGSVALILAGAAVSALMLALISLALNLAANPYAAYEITAWLLGSLADKSWNQVWLAAPFILVGSALLAVTARSLDALSLGEAQAESLGVHLGRLNLLALVGTALAVGAATAVTGAIGFVGLVAPHLMRPLVGHQPSRVLWPATLAGAALLLAADIATRLIHIGPGLKIGVFTAIVGTPLFFWLVVRLRHNAP
ncbi:MAG: FecCD family ABC transporter permease [Steroidobacteraceae bacterium]